jgi:hypothetical protein
MTLNISLLTEHTIYQSADLRLINCDTKRIEPDRSTKIVTLLYPSWSGFVTYTGIGRWHGKHTSTQLIDWLTGIKTATFAETAARICEAGTEYLGEIERGWERRKHSFILVGFEGGLPQLAVISNFENIDRVFSASPQALLRVAAWTFSGRARHTINGIKSAVSGTARASLFRILRESPEDPQRVRNLLARINSDAASSSLSGRSISPECTVYSLRSDGKGMSIGELRAEPLSIAFGNPLPTIETLEKALGYKLGRVRGVSFATSSSRPQTPFGRCAPRIVTPADSAGYSMEEVTHASLGSMRAQDTNIIGATIGCGCRPGENENFRLLWTRAPGALPIVHEFPATPFGINSHGVAAVTARMDDNSEHAVRWTPEAATDLGCYRGIDSSARAINDSGLVVGSIGLDPVDRSQLKQRPAIWSDGTLTILDDELKRLGFDWGNAVDVNDQGMILVLAYKQLMQSAVILWDPRNTRYKLIGIGIYPLSITSNNSVLGKARATDENCVTCMARPDGSWVLLETPADFEPSAMNDALDVVGVLSDTGSQRPYLIRHSGEVIPLPYYDDHSCPPIKINNSGVIVGHAMSDHGSHALIWTPREGPS